MKIAIIGCGNMGRALALPLSKAHQLFFYDHNSEKAESLAQNGLGLACKEKVDAIKASDTLILAIKPQSLKKAAERIRGALRENQLVVSILAGISLDTLKSTFPTAAIVRMMPNLAVAHGDGVIGLTADENVEKGRKDELTKACELLGKLYWIPEEKMDALTVLAGSGPAFFFTMIEAMVDAGIAMGFNSRDSQDLVCQMLQGSLTLLEKAGKHPGELKWQITSPKGVTIQGLRKLEETGLRGSIINTFLAASDYLSSC